MSKIPKKRSYFCGWYVKQQNASDVVAFIPAFHVNEKGQEAASLQVITDDFAASFDYSINELSFDKKRFFVRVGDNIFSENYCSVKIKENGYDIEGTLRYVRFTKPNYDVMGPFRLLPLECRHFVLSLTHQVWGELLVNGRKIAFENSRGYVEGDLGRSFPENYIWTQVLFDNNSIFAAVADVPVFNKSITGIAAIILYRHKQYRFATYLGARIEHLTSKSVYIRQGNMSLYIERQDFRGKNLLAPKNGSMERIVHECPSCTVRYCFAIKDEIVFDIISELASYEYNLTS